jgi:hypothetical protein
MDKVSFILELMRQDKTKSKISAICSAVLWVMDRRLPTMIVSDACNSVTEIVSFKGRFIYILWHIVIYIASTTSAEFFVLFELAVRIETIEFVLVQSQHRSYRRSSWGRTNRRTKYSKSYNETKRDRKISADVELQTDDCQPCLSNYFCLQGLLTSSITIWLRELVIYGCVRNSRNTAFAYIAVPYSPGSPTAVPFAQREIVISQFLMRIQ